MAFIAVVSQASIPGSQRTLAAIVFTDVVGFSARMQRDEVHTLRLLQRDFADMRRLCAEHEGSVLKTTGDGLLLRFTSAVQAVAGALAMQRHFAAQAKTLPSADILEHRIGIHLGDVLVQEHDVMGDGVNIASRLQAEAEPGGICISQTVYDVVKNKLELRVVSLGERELKNIAEAMPVYRLLLEAQAERGGGNGSASPGAGARTGPRRAWLIGGLAVLAVALGVAGLALRNRDQPADRSAAPATAPVSEPTAPPVEEENEPERREGLAQLRTRYDSYLKTYDFAGLAQQLRRPGNDLPRRQAQLLSRVASQMGATKDWTLTALRSYTRQRPLRVKELSSGREVRVFVGPDQRLQLLEGGGGRGREWAQLPPALAGSVIVAAIGDAASPPPRDVIQGALAIARVYHLPEMVQALADLRRGVRN